MCLENLLNDFFQQPRPPNFQQEFRRYFLTLAQNQQDTHRADIQTHWQNVLDCASQICRVVTDHFHNKAVWPTALEHLLLILKDPLEISENQEREFRAGVGGYLKAKGIDVWWKNPGVKVPFVFDSQGTPWAKVYMVHAVICPYQTNQQGDPLWLAGNFTFRADDFGEALGSSIKTARQACIDVLGKKGQPAFWTLAGRPFGGWLGWVSLVCALLGALVCLIFSLSGAGLFRGFSVGMLPWLSLSEIRWAFVISWVVLFAALSLPIVYWKLKWKFKRTGGQPFDLEQSCFQVFIGGADGEPFGGPSPGGGFLCAFVAAALPKLHSVPPWAKELRAIMAENRLSISTALEGVRFSEVGSIVEKIEAIQNDKEITRVIFPWGQITHVLNAWGTGAQTIRSRNIGLLRDFEVETRSGVKLLFFENLESLKRYFDDFQPGSLYVRRALFVVTLIFFAAFAFTRTPPPEIQLEIKDVVERLKPSQPPGWVVPMTPREVVRLRIRILSPKIPWSFRLEMTSTSGVFAFKLDEFQSLISRSIRSDKEEKIWFRMPSNESMVFVKLIVRDKLNRSVSKVIQFVTMY